MNTRTMTAATTPPTIGPRFVLGPEEAYVEAVLIGIENVEDLRFVNTEEIRVLKVPYDVRLAVVRLVVEGLVPTPPSSSYTR